MSEQRLCGAQAWRTFVVEGLFVAEQYNSAIVTCTLPSGHDTEHAGWLSFKTGVGDVNAKVIW